MTAIPPAGRDAPAPTPWDYLETEPASDAPISDNPSGLYCPACRLCGMSHCGQPEECGGMRRMRTLGQGDDENPADEAIELSEEEYERYHERQRRIAESATFNFFAPDDEATPDD